MNGWSFGEPAALCLLLALPILYWIARRAPAARPQWTGALAIWRRVAPAATASGAAARRSVPPHVWAALAAFAAGSVALAAPRRAAEAAAGPQWTLVLDRSPSMYLPAGAGAPPRIARAVELALAECERAAVAPDARTWLAFDSAGPQSGRGARPPDAWLDARAASDAEIPWLQLDTAAHVWLSDCEPAFPPLRAGRVHTGAGAAPGPVADAGDAQLAWDGRRLVEAPWSGARAGVLVESGVPAELAALARAWAEERRLPEAAGAEGACLRLGAPPGSRSAPAQDGELQGDGWSARARAAPLAPAAGFATWAELATADGERAPAVLWRRGEIALALESIDVGAADPAALAVAWIDLFDRARTPEPGIVPLEERLREGPAVVAPPAGGEQAARTGMQFLAHVPALAASVCALLAAFLALRAR